jgi:hypothetical protein
VAAPNRHDTGSTAARSVDEVALIRNTISHYAPVLIAPLPKSVALACREFFLQRSQRALENSTAFEGLDKRSIVTPRARSGSRAKSGHQPQTDLRRPLSGEGALTNFGLGDATSVTSLCASPRECLHSGAPCCLISRHCRVRPRSPACSSRPEAMVAELPKKQGPAMPGGPGGGMGGMGGMDF